MDDSELNTTPYAFDEKVIKYQRSSRRRKHRKPVMDHKTSKKDRKMLMHLQQQIVKLNKKMNADIKKQKQCKIQSLEKTVKSVEKKLKLRKQSKKNKKQKNAKKETPAASNFALFGNSEEEKKEATENTPTEMPSTENPPTEMPSTENPPTEMPSTENPPTEMPSTEMPSTEMPPSETETPPAENKGVMASVTEAANNAAQSLGLSSSETTTAQKSTGGRSKRRGRGKGKGKGK